MAMWQGRTALAGSAVLDASAGELGRAKKLREKRIGNDVLSLRLLDMTVFHQLALGGIYSRRDSERMTSSICIAKLIRPFARQVLHLLEFVQHDNGPLLS